jgi:UDP-N-acetylglucosamine transferase subunit ALG13
VIFVTAGTQLPFDRLVEAIDYIAAEYKDVSFVVQALTSKYKAKNIKVVSFLTPAEFAYNLNHAQLIISHAGMGTIISALEKKIPIIVLPRLFSLDEHRNDHQLGTAKQMDVGGYVHVAYDARELITMFTTMWPDNLTIRSVISDEPSEEFIQSLNNYIKN